HRGLTWRDVLLIGLGEGVAALRQRLGEDPARWQWGRIHELRLEHPLARVAPLRRLLNRGGFAIGGDGGTPLQTGAAPSSAAAPVPCVPTVRRTAASGDRTGWVCVIPGGQSGPPLSRHYADQIELFMGGRYHPMLWTRADVEANLEAETRLLPTDELWPRP